MYKHFRHLVLVGYLRGLFSASCTKFFFAGHSDLYCGDSPTVYWMAAYLLVISGHTTHSRLPVTRRCQSARLMASMKLLFSNIFLLVKKTTLSEVFAHKSAKGAQTKPLFGTNVPSTGWCNKILQLLRKFWNLIGVANSRAAEAYSLNSGKLPDVVRCFGYQLPYTNLYMCQLCVPISSFSLHTQIWLPPYWGC